MADLKRIDGVEIFQEGVWNGDEYTEADIIELEKSFNEVGNELKPFVKLGHSEKQKLLAEDELPAAGWIEKVYRSGSKLLADIKDIPAKVYELIKNKGYKRISAEIYFNYKCKEGKTYPLALRAVSLLGSATPAVGTLDDILALYGSTEPVKLFKDETNTNIKIYEWEETMDQEQIKKYEDQLAEAQEKIKAFESEASESKKKADEIELARKEVEERLKAFELEARVKSIDTKVDSFVEEKKILPSQRDYLKAFYMNLESKEIEISEKKFSMSDLLDEIFSLNKFEFIPDKEISEDVKGKDTAESWELKAEKYASENNISYREALIELSRKEN